MLLDNHFGPDPRVAFESKLLEEARISTRIIAWDRRPQSESNDRPSSPPRVVRVAVPTRSGGGWRSVLGLARFGARVWRRRKQLLGGGSLIVVHDIYLLPLGWALGRRLGLPFVYDAHEEYARMEATRYPSWLLRLIATIESHLARKAAAVVVPGESRRQRWEGVVEPAPIVLPNLVRRDPPSFETDPPEWDLLYAGTIAGVRRLDLLVELARRRPDLRIAIAGRGRGVDDVVRWQADLPNLTYLGWRSDTDDLFTRTHAIYYGLDPKHPYSDVACPNTLYEALRHRKPLVFFCGGEMAQLSAEFKIGIRCSPSLESLSAAVNRVLADSGWEFEAAWRAAWERAETHRFVDAIEAAAQRST
jgi:hypothetical protein